MDIGGRGSGSGYIRWDQAVDIDGVHQPVGIRGGVRQFILAGGSGSVYRRGGQVVDIGGRGSCSGFRRGGSSSGYSWRVMHFGTLSKKSCRFLQQ